MHYPRSCRSFIAFSFILWRANRNWYLGWISQDHFFMNINSIQFHSGIVEQASETKMLCCGTGSLRRLELLSSSFLLQTNCGCNWICWKICSIQLTGFLNFHSGFWLESWKHHLIVILFRDYKESGTARRLFAVWFGKDDCCWSICFRAFWYPNFPMKRIGFWLILSDSSDLEADWVLILFVYAEFARSSWNFPRSEVNRGLYVRKMSLSFFWPESRFIAKNARI